ncbi:MAG: hypothetical protein ABSG51_18320 [Terracidiphilus sp.]
MAQLTSNQVQKLLVLWLLATTNPQSSANPGGINLSDPGLLNQVKAKLSDNNEDPLFVIHAMQIFNSASQNMPTTLTSTSQDMTSFINIPASDGTSLDWGVGPQCPAGSANILSLFP